jgi:hypothetical protein
MDVVVQGLCSAKTYDEWLSAAEHLDRLEGAEEWKEDPQVCMASRHTCAGLFYRDRIALDFSTETE